MIRMYFLSDQGWTSKIYLRSTGRPSATRRPFWTWMTIYIIIFELFHGGEVPGQLVSINKQSPPKAQCLTYLISVLSEANNPVGVDWLQVCLYQVLWYLRTFFSIFHLHKQNSYCPYTGKEIQTHWQKSTKTQVEKYRQTKRNANTQAKRYKHTCKQIQTHVQK